MLHLSPMDGCSTYICLIFSKQAGGMSCETNISTNNTAFERSSKRRKGYPSETKVKKGHRVVHGEKDLVEKLGRNDLCPCGSSRRFQTLLSPHGRVRWWQPQLLFSGSSSAVAGEAKRSKENLLTFAFCSPIVRGGRGNGKRVAFSSIAFHGSHELGAAR